MEAKNQKPEIDWCEADVNHMEEVLSSNHKPMCSGMRDRWNCTKPDGHNGFHVACGTNGHNYAAWRDGDERIYYQDIAAEGSVEQ